MDSWFYAFVPVAVAALGSAWAALRRPPDKAIGVVQHFAAGVVFYAAAGEILPQTVETTAVWSVVLGGGLGIIAMLLIRQFSKRVAESPIGLVSASTVDALVDGLVLGLGFSAGKKQGILLTIALAIEFLFLGLSIGGAFEESTHRWKVVAAATLVATAVPVGVLVAQPIDSLSPTWQVTALSFGLIALLYLVTEELLAEAHRKPETALGAAAFFIGFLLMTVISREM